MRGGYSSNDKVEVEASDRRLAYPQSGSENGAIAGDPTTLHLPDQDNDVFDGQRCLPPGPRISAYYRQSLEKARIAQEVMDGRKSFDDAVVVLRAIHAAGPEQGANLRLPGQAERGLLDRLAEVLDDLAAELGVLSMQPLGRDVLPTSFDELWRMASRASGTKAMSKDGVGPGCAGRIDGADV
jgi:hypothetical protein